MRTYRDIVRELVEAPKGTSYGDVQKRKLLVNEAGTAARADSPQPNAEAISARDTEVSTESTYLGAVRELVSIVSTDGSPEAVAARRRAISECSVAAAAFSTAVEPEVLSPDTLAEYARYDAEANAGLARLRREANSVELASAKDVPFQTILGPGIREAFMQDHEV